MAKNLKFAPALAILGLSVQVFAQPIIENATPGRAVCQEACSIASNQLVADPHSMDKRQRKFVRLCEIIYELKLLRRSEFAFTEPSGFQQFNADSRPGPKFSSKSDAEVSSMRLAEILYYIDSHGMLTWEGEELECVGPLKIVK